MIATKKAGGSLRREKTVRAACMIAPIYHVRENKMYILDQRGTGKDTETRFEGCHSRRVLRIRALGSGDDLNLSIISAARSPDLYVRDVYDGTASALYGTGPARGVLP